MSNRLLEERIKTLEREIADLKALLGAQNGRSKPSYTLSTAARERRESSRTVRESERDYC